MSCNIRLQKRVIVINIVPGKQYREMGLQASVKRFLNNKYKLVHFNEISPYWYIGEIGEIGEINW